MALNMRPRQGTSVDQAVARKALHQRGLVTARQLQQLQIGRSALRTRLRRGQWTTVERGLYRVHALPDTWESTLLAHILSAGDAAMASHRSAAALYDLDGFRRPTTFEIVLPASKRRRRNGVIIHRSSDLHLVKATTPKGIPATPIGRTLLDLGAVVPIRQVLLAVDDARRRSLISWDGLLTVREIHARRGRNGAATLRSILDDHSSEVAKTDSGFERLVMLLLVEQGLPKPQLQHEVHVNGNIYRIDLAYPEQRVAIELDGQVHLQREVWENDHVREANLASAGWRVLRFTWHRYLEDPAFIIRTVRAALQRQPHPR